MSTRSAQADTPMLLDDVSRISILKHELLSTSETKWGMWIYSIRKGCLLKVASQGFVTWDAIVRGIDL